MRISLTALLLISAALFVVGVSAERNVRHSEAAGHSESMTSGEHAAETTGESAPQLNGEAHRESGAEGASPTHAEGPAAAPQRFESGERLAGVDIESTAVVVSAVLAAALLALGLWIAPGASSITLWLIVGFASVSLVLDGREVIHQINEGRDAIVVIASILALMHLAIVGLAVAMLRTVRRSAHGVQPAVS